MTKLSLVLILVLCFLQTGIGRKSSGGSSSRGSIGGGGWSSGGSSSSSSSGGGWGTSSQNRGNIGGGDGIRVDLPVVEVLEDGTLGVQFEYRLWEERRPRKSLWK
nr:ctenidin-1-like [Lepeophtheirus salmonis]